MEEILSRSLKDGQLIGPHVCSFLEQLSAHRYGHSIAEDYLDAFWDDFVRRCPIMSDSFRKILLNLGEYNLDHRSSVSDWISEKIGEKRISPILRNFFSELEKKTDERLLWQKNTQQYFVCWLRQYYHSNSNAHKCET
ncbi:Oidioi.mRNA.OKI2018_I69.chr2.g7832.t1.cds [Oikopleura dioica]|uniref:Oidioi.mRNA.OKI2018_I69.chr2.g7832.t1.cds n=1 Tax=Oikopleura dioica TaxID=34765 RepID=A0ABN7TC08_OIKDI|nr:Oidioi.mRNA.OKI2018_I69.chr2.g7832.t1.cds [Oikopleura dioica]